ncbi:MAG: type II toxin-antitoxin system HicA family toxin [Rectinemataceae bacterium]
MGGKELLKRLKKDGWTVARISGSHFILAKGSERIILPVHGTADVKPGILNSILKKAGMK